MKYKEKWANLLTNKRLGEEDKFKNRGEDIRSDFQRDYDRIIFSNSFRRLDKKTQVHPLSKNDHIHTRLIHSLEVSSVGRSLGLKLGNFLREKGDLPDNYMENDIANVVQVACLAHDIGNPPFGHAGEYAIRHWFSNEGKDFLKGLEEDKQKDFLLFEGNAQGFRIVTQLEDRYMDGGMRLTYASLGTLVKYPWLSSTTKAKEKKKFSVFHSEKKIFEKVFNELQLNKCTNIYKRHPLSYLMEAADDICYKILDIEDAVELSIISYEKAKKILCEIIKFNPENKKEDLCDAVEKHVKGSKRRKIGKLRAKAINSLIEIVFEEYMKNYDCIMEGEYDTGLLNKLIKEDENLENIFKDIEKLNKENIFAERNKVEIEVGAYKVISVLLENFVEAVYALSEKNETFKHESVLKLMGVESPKKEDDYYVNLLRVTDYISGMTDNYATYIANQLTGNFQ